MSSQVKEAPQKEQIDFPRILHIDDNPDYLNIFSRAFRKWFRVVPANSAEEALDILEKGSFDAVVTDYDMPGMNGLELLTAVRELHPDIPVIFNTGQGNEEIAREAFIKGVSDYFIKDVFGFAHREKFANSVNRAIKTRKTLIEKKESEEKFKKLSELLPQTIFEMDQVGNFTYSNRHGFITTGYSEEDIEKGLNVLDLFRGKDKELIISNMRMADDPDGVTIREFKVFRKNGTTFPALIYSTPIIRDGKPSGYRGVLIDISERKEVEKALLKSEKKFRNIIQYSPMGIHMYKLDSEGRLIFTGANIAADNLLGIDNSQFVGQTIEDAFPALIGTGIIDQYKEIARFGGTWKTEQVIYKDEKIDGAFEVYAFQTIPNKMVAVFLNISKFKIREEELESKISCLQEILKTTAPLIVSLDKELKITFISREQDGFTQSCLNKPFIDFVNDNEKERIEKDLQSILENDVEEDTELICKVKSSDKNFKIHICNGKSKKQKTGLVLTINETG